MLRLAWTFALLSCVGGVGAVGAEGPPLSVQLTVDGKELSLAVPDGADVDEIARSFGAEHGALAEACLQLPRSHCLRAVAGLGAGGVADVARIVLQQQAQAAGRELSYILPVNLGGGKEVHLPVHAQENQQQVTSTAATPHPPPPCLPKGTHRATATPNHRVYRPQRRS